MVTTRTREISNVLRDSRGRYCVRQIQFSSSPKRTEPCPFPSLFVHAVLDLLDLRSHRSDSFRSRTFPSRKRRDENPGPLVRFVFQFPFIFCAIEVNTESSFSPPPFKNVPTLAETRDDESQIVLRRHARPRCSRRMASLTAMLSQCNRNIMEM